MKEFAVLISCESEDLSEALLEAAAYVSAFSPMFHHMNVGDQVPINDLICVQRRPPTNELTTCGHPKYDACHNCEKP